ncbi:Uncharacterised protein [Salmonella enterica subsp. enterica]|uniref:Uncharacterized protein n=1 Tax=Salmonella enterica I TaxID=59201 RepID=A0A379X0G1_SALET|nr:Uncharacterised protein [Salmonella enterica subsp. enterica]
MAFIEGICGVLMSVETAITAGSGMLSVSTSSSSSRSTVNVLSVRERILLHAVNRRNVQRFAHQQTNLLSIKIGRTVAADKQIET